MLTPQLARQLEQSQAILSLFDQKLASFTLFVLAIFFRALHYLTLPVEVLLRRNLGSRYLGHIHVLFLGVLAWACLYLPVSRGMTLLLLAAGGFGGWHYFWALYGEMIATNWPWLFTRAQGTCWGPGVLGWWGLLQRLKLPVNVPLIHLVFEPALCFVVGTLISPFDRMLGGFLCLSALALFTKMAILALQTLENLRDFNDNQVLAKQIKDGRRGSPIAPLNQPFVEAVVAPPAQWNAPGQARPERPTTKRPPATDATKKDVEDEPASCEPAPPAESLATGTITCPVCGRASRPPAGPPGSRTVRCPYCKHRWVIRLSA